MNMTGRIGNRHSAPRRNQRKWTTDFTDFTDNAIAGRDAWPRAVPADIRAIGAIRGKISSKMNDFDILQ
jgi:hypothetical protein